MVIVNSGWWIPLHGKGCSKVTIQWESVSVERGPFIAWGNEPGQLVAGKILSVGTGTDTQGREVPEYRLEIVEPSESISAKSGITTNFAVGEEVTLTAGQTNLRRWFEERIPGGVNVGDMVRISFEKIMPTQTGGTAKIFDVKVARGSHSADVLDPAAEKVLAGMTASAYPQGSFGVDTSAQPPF